MIYPSFVHFTSLLHKIVDRDIVCRTEKKGVPSVESSRSVRGLGKGVSGKPYPRLHNVRRPRLEPGTFRSQAVRLYRLHQARPSHPSPVKSYVELNRTKFTWGKLKQLRAMSFTPLIVKSHCFSIYKYMHAEYSIFIASNKLALMTSYLKGVSHWMFPLK